VKKYVLLDRDGTVIVNKHYQKDPAETEILPGAADGLRALRDAGYGLVLLTNQSGIGRGYFTRADVDAIHRRMADLIGLGADLFDGIYICPHVDADNCRCRKPLPGLAEQAEAELGFDPADAVVVGDREVDIEMARAAGAGAVHVRTGYGAEVDGTDLCSPDFVADDLVDAARWILSR
jgi:D-glycero-D-manno-heptose 1,7-bisphosphate phosphatase